ncbi:preprotein translocase, SecA subunit [Thermovirga lienii DSM 17291]|jgi:preprotein translocase subunit SecA|uniref:Protein translocase subunit SecA n=1 Tax=Thermovirga lienii (strain ATCC BAA-1197 / DSM 17291 / Cas60314) TaxID=580340 RepID=G7V672_THELD|nr:preprotein translocase subunit SecA [Thermovirga lienii]AER67059.1 preprotein translocase, SecA subunit [Thermovirga lienii DSM 17291]MDN5318376.1 preprotein translocase subunit SecA [Thermovirga sp.]MDN5367665.1 preprotein translocase subunit SecA [Thermovirga sp.]HCD71531.1 preprotein translocase subunit SecA [Thermovirga lienii]
MFEGLKKKLGLDKNERHLKRYRKIVEAINSLEPEMEKLSDEELSNLGAKYRERILRGESLDSLLSEVFAAVREVSKRVLGLRHFDVQLMGGIALHEGKIAEMKTGEGKTLVATLPVVLNALSGKGVHVVTVNDYLAKRDAEWMRPIYNFFGLSVGVIYAFMDNQKRKEAYQADITYGTNTEFGFDYLRDNMALHSSQLVQRGHEYIILDEVDSILIDEARTPLIISGPSEDNVEIYKRANDVALRLKPQVHFEIDEKERNVALTEEGIAECEKLLGVENLFGEYHNSELGHRVVQALKAHYLFEKDVHYVVKDNEIVIVDEFTGRLMFGRRYSDGLHQAIEAKERVPIGRENQTLATITLQNYVRMYRKIAGMTGTAATEEEEFKEIYGLEVVVIPTNKPMIRQDYPDVILRTKKEKFAAVADEIEETYKSGQPVLVGTTSIENSERLSKILKARKIPHHVLNAKYHEKEAQIVAQAGRLHAVTVATNMAGRGTDIILGGNPEFLAREEMAKAGLDWTEHKDEYERILKEKKEECQKEHEKVVALGGLKVIGTERHESRRIDNQLRGRSGRQGDPGCSRFYLSLEDDLLRLFGSERIDGLMQKLGMEEGESIEHGLISKAIESAQKKVEQYHFDIRRQLLLYDNVMNQQREAVYEERRSILTGNNLIERALQIIEDAVKSVLSSAFSEEGEPQLEAVSIKLKGIFGPGVERPLLDVEDPRDLEEASEKIIDLLRERFRKKIAEMGDETANEIIRFVFLHVLDSAWKEHLLAMDELRRGIGLRAIGQKDPLLEYQFESFNLFSEMMERVRLNIAEYLFRVSVVKDEELQKGDDSRVRESRDLLPIGMSVPDQRGTQTAAGDQVGRREPIRKGPKVGRNDPCPCGSGKKYKHCCGKN